mmetsp:Transcript_7429/g.10293  ORF Transcript_7429/g.10293 Transcript_7429/m.10293 type:complete len:93 (-) Transcript_7429:295-573(-)
MQSLFAKRTLEEPKHGWHVTVESKIPGGQIAATSDGLFTSLETKGIFEVNGATDTVMPFVASLTSFENNLFGIDSEGHILKINPRERTKSSD